MAPLDASTIFTVTGMVAVVTGGGTGLGLMMAKALAANGAHKVYIIGRRKEKLDAAAAHAPDIIVPIVGDVTSKESLQAIADQVAAEVGYVNLLVANSGVVGPSVAGIPPNPTVKQFRDFAWSQWSMEDFTNTFHVNNTAAFFTVIAFLELLDVGNKKKNVDGVTSQVIITGSIAAYIRHVVSGFAYVQSKAGAVQLMKALATYMAPFGIRCNALAPGLFPSEMTKDMLDKMASSGTGQVQTFPRTMIPAERAGTEEDMVGTTLYLASRAGAYLSGCAIVIDGGRLSVLPSSY